MRTQYYTAASLDGFIATVDDSLEWLFPLDLLYAPLRFSECTVISMVCNEPPVWKVHYREAKR